MVNYFPLQRSNNQFPTLTTKDKNNGSKRKLSGNVTDMHKPTHLQGWKYISHMQIVMFYYLSCIVLKHSRERRVTVKRQLTD